MTTPVNIHAQLFLVTTQDFKAVVSFGAEEFGKSVMGAFILACEHLGLDPDDYPVPHKDWNVQTLGAPTVSFMRDSVVVAQHK